MTVRPARHRSCRRSGGVRRARCLSISANDGREDRVAGWASLGGVVAAKGLMEAQPDEIDRLVLLAVMQDSPPEKLKGRKLFIVARE